MGAQAPEEGRPPSPFADGTGFCSVCLYRTRLWVPAAADRPAAWLCEEEDSDLPRRGAAPRPPAPARAPRPDAGSRPPRPRPDLLPTVDEHELAHRSRSVGRVLAMSGRLTRSPEEWVGRESHTVWLGGPLVEAARDPEAPEGVRAWAEAVLVLLRDQPRRRALQVQHLTPEQLAADDAYADGLL